MVIVVPAPDLPAQRAVRQRTVLRVAGAASQGDLLPDFKELGRSGRLDGRLGRGVAREDLYRSGGRDRTAAILHLELGGVGTVRVVGMASGWGAGLGRGGPIAEVPYVG